MPGLEIVSVRSLNQGILDFDDLSHIDFGVTALGSITATQHLGYTLHLGGKKADVFKGLLEDLRRGDRLQDFINLDTKIGLAPGDGIRQASQDQTIDEGIEGRIHSHPTGNAGLSSGGVIVLTSRDEPPKVELIPTPQAGSGSAVIRVLNAGVLSYAGKVYNGTRPYTFPTPLVPGFGAIARVASVGPDATLLKCGQLVYFDATIYGRDDPHAIFLSGLHDGYTEGSKKLMNDEWRDGTYAEYAKVPLEGCTVLDEKRLLWSVDEDGLGYQLEDLVIIARLLVPYGGLRDIHLKPGETVIIAPATGPFGGAAVHVALAMGARVIAMGRNLSVLESLAAHSERVFIVQITGDTAADTASLRAFGAADVYFDISPPQAAKSTHIKSAIMALRHEGRISLMGGIREDIAIPHSVVMHGNLVIKGTWMYPREAIGEMLKMIEVGVLRLGESIGQRLVGTFGLEEWSEAFKAAAENTAAGDLVLITP
ncbi:MAG: hypothetical protein M1818_004902 [Claussenomyces sp. TS43310]|nr:MAG: hypothetical protein M1818_004902 [Claussenomyces sp. TS43310]